MSPVLKLALLLVVALLIGRVSWRPGRAGMGVNLVFALGTHFLLFGILLGPVSGVLSRDVVRALSPFIALGLGWTGMLIGAQLDRGQLRSFTARLPLAMFCQGVLAFLFAWGCAWLAWFVIPNPKPFWAPTGPAMLTLAAVVAASAPGAVAFVSTRFRARGPVAKLLLYFSSLDGLVALLVVAATFATHHTDLEHGPRGPGTWLVVSVLVGALVGGLFVSLTRGRPSPDELVLFLAGTALFASGAAYALQLSPLVVGLVVGIVIANLSRYRRRAYATLAAWEKPIYGVLLILAGAMLRPPGWEVVPVVIALLLVRFGAKLFAMWAALKVTAAGAGPRRLGLGLYAQGGLSLAIVIGYSINYGGATEAADVVVAAVVLAAAISELAAPFLLKNVLARAGELGEPAVVAPAPG